MEVERVRVLVVDDYERWRGFICSNLENQPYLQIIGVATDGLEAIQRAGELLPDLVLLDIGLPRLNGIEALRCILKSSPRTKVVMVSETRSGEVAQEALRLGAGGYVVKSGAAGELLPAIEAVLQGKQFLSPLLTDSVNGNRGNGYCVSAPLLAKDEILPSRVAKPHLQRRHDVEFYAEDAAFVAGFAGFIESELARGSAVIIIVHPSHRPGLLQKLNTRGLDIHSLAERGGVFLIDAVETLSKVMRDGMPDPDRCAQTVRDIFSRATGGATGPHPRIAICGECAPTLLREGKTEAAIQLEHLWEEVTKGYDADTLCGYVWSAVPVKERRSIVDKICAEHTSAFGREVSC